MPDPATWRVAPTGRTHAFYGLRPLRSVCTRVPFEGTRLSRAGEVVAPCKHCVHRVNEQAAVYRALKLAGLAGRR